MGMMQRGLPRGGPNIFDWMGNWQSQQEQDIEQARQQRIRQTMADFEGGNKNMEMGAMGEAGLLGPQMDPFSGSNRRAGMMRNFFGGR